jgi:hypothetical protein
MMQIIYYITTTTIYKNMMFALQLNSSVFARLGNKPMAAVTASTMSTKEVSVKFNDPSLKYAGVLKKTTSSVEPTKKKIIKVVKSKSFFN